ncbi:hypothetical protein [Streptomyces sp. NPDC005374]|uniref:hypothetical protein n=1 Tax=Streptomyces sp. NPDC005374 TaxID=3364713 RepID=UPI0036A0FBA0
MVDLPTHSDATDDAGEQTLVRGMSKRTRMVLIAVGVVVVVAVILLHVTGVIGA